MRELGSSGEAGDGPQDRERPEPRGRERSQDEHSDAMQREVDALRLEYAQQRHDAREARISEAAERGVSREEFVAKEAAAREDERQAEELASARAKIERPAVWGPPETHESQRREPYERQDRALEHFRTVPVDGPDNTPIDPDRRRTFPATTWSRFHPPFPAGDLSRRDELIYERYEPTEREPESFGLPERRSDLAGSTQPVAEPLRDRYPEGIEFSERGHPDLGRYASKTVELRNGFDRPEHAEVDGRANDIFGWESTPEGKIWHKSGDGRRVWLVDADLHEQYGQADAENTEDDAPASIDQATPELERRDGPIRLETSDPDHKEQLNHPAPDSTIIVDDRFTYRTDDQGRVTHASARLTVVDLDHPRSRSAQTELVGRLPGDHAGHIFARIFQGPADSINLTPMEANKVNLSAYKKIENTWRSALEDGKDVRVEVELVYRKDSMRPDAFAVTYWIDGQVTYNDIPNLSAKDDHEHS